MPYSESVTIRTRDCDMSGHWKPSSIMEAMQEVAIDHCNSINLGRSVMDSLGIAWILSRCRVEIYRHPRIGEVCTVETWAMPTRHLFFPRAHTIRDADGNPIGEACGLWLLMDLKQRKAVPNPFVMENLPFEDRSVSVRVGGAIRPVSEFPVKQALTPQYTDFDLNGHVNNAKYLDWCWNALGSEALRECRIASFDVEYDQEVLPGEHILTEAALDGNDFSFLGFTGENKRCFAIRGALAATEG